MFQRFWLLLRWQKGRKEAWFRLLLVRIYEKIFAGLKSLNSTLNQLYLKKAPEEISDQHQKQKNIYHNLTLFKTIFNFNVYPRGCTDSNVRIIYQVKRFFFYVTLIKWYFSGPVNLEKKRKKVDLCGRVNGLPEFSWASQLWFPLKTWPQVYIKKRKVGLAWRETWLALLCYPFWIVESNSVQGFLGWNHHSLLISYVLLTLSDNIITLIRGNTK